MRTLVLSVLVLCRFLPACGGEGSSAAVAATKVPNAADAAAAPAGKAPQCATGQRRLALAAGSEVRWLAVKSDGVPVVGVHPASGSLTVASDGGLAAPALQLAFSAEGLLSDLTLRDERLRRIIFRAQEALPFGFKLTGIEGADGKPVGKLPDPGMGAQLQLTGDVTLAGLTVPVSVPVVLSMHLTSIQVSDGVAGVHLDLRKILKLGGAVDALMALVPGVELEDDLQLRFNLMLEEVCRA